MEILNVRAARSVWLFDPMDLNPRGLSPVPFFSAIKERYHFLGWPKTPDELSWTTSSPKGIRFIDGAFSVENQLRAVSVTFYNDGIIADTASSTRHSDAFLEDLLSFAAQHFGVTFRPDIVHQKRYISEMIVRAERDLSVACERIARLALRLTELSGTSESFQWFGFELRHDPKISAPAEPSFKFEREVQKPSVLNRYFSSAPLQTEAHEELLRDFERIMAE